MSNNLIGKSHVRIMFSERQNQNAERLKSFFKRHGNHPSLKIARNSETGGVGSEL